MEVDQIVESLGGTAKIAALCHVSKAAVSNWKARASIPAEYWQALVKEAERRGVWAVTYALLGHLHAKSNCEPVSDPVQP